MFGIIFLEDKPFSLIILFQRIPLQRGRENACTCNYLKSHHKCFYVTHVSDVINSRTLFNPNKHGFMQFFSTLNILTHH